MKRTVHRLTLVVGAGGGDGTLDLFSPLEALKEILLTGINQVKA